jgi:hypothetical protein
MVSSIDFNNLYDKVVVKNLPTKLQGNKDYSPSVRKYLAKNGGKKVVSFVIGRSPVKGSTQQLLQLISLGKFNESQKKLGYDHFYHLFLIGTFENGQHFRLEKLSKIVLVPDNGAKPEGDGTTSMQCPAFQPKTLLEILDAAREQSGEEAFFVYDAFAFNCQAFVASILKPLGAYTEEVKKFAYQPVQSLVKEQHSYFTYIAKKATDAHAIANRLIEGEGLARGNRDLHQHFKRIVKNSPYLIE